VAFWSVILVDAATLAMLFAFNERVAEPNEASVTKISFELGNSAVPKSTAVPEGEERVSVVETAPLATGKTERKPVLLTAGFPFTVVNIAEESALKNVWETVLSGPEGGVVWFRANGRSAVSSGERPVVGDMVRQARPALAPELATHARESLDERVTETGKSPSVETGWPRGVRIVGSDEEMLNMERVLEPGFTATRDLWG
jgi:hypothetical protein